MSKTILIVDDLATERIHLRKILERNGFNVVEAKGGAEGIASSLSERPAGILMDVVMPDVSGFQATRAIKKNPETKHIPIIMVTTKDRAPDKLNAKDNGACAYVVKPATEEGILDALKVAGLA